MIGINMPPALIRANDASRLTMDRGHLVALLGAALALATSAANAQQFYGQAPSYRSSPNSHPVPARQSAPANVTTSPPVPIQRSTPPSAASPVPQSASAQTAQPAPSEPLRPPAPASSAASTQAASACMNAQKSASVDIAIKGCDTVISETLKNLANAYYFRGTAKFGKK